MNPLSTSEQHVVLQRQDQALDISVDWFAISLGMEQLLTAYRALWQIGYAEELVGNIRRECLDHVIILNVTHLRGILESYVHHYNTQRTHLGIAKDSPETREVQLEGQIDKVAVVGGLHHCYYRRAA